MKRIYLAVLVQTLKILGMFGRDSISLRKNTSGNSRILLNQLLKDLSVLHNLVRVEAVRVTSELLEASKAALEESERQIQNKEQELAERTSGIFDENS